MLEIRNVSKIYGSRMALDGVSLHVSQGEIIGLFGENGAGKTTLMKSILSFVPYSGEITLFGEKITHKNIARISFATSEHSFFPDLTPLEHAAFYAAHFPAFDRRRFDVLMEFFALPGSRRAGALSTGQKNQLEVILALSQGADLILMDEPFAGNDIFNREDFYKVLLGILTERETVMLSTHLIEEVAGFISRAVLISHGKMIGDKTVAQLDDEGRSLMDYVRSSFGYSPGRAARALDELERREEG